MFDKSNNSYSVVVRKHIGWQSHALFMCNPAIEEGPISNLV